MPAPLILYSTNSWIAFAVSERFFKKRHWVWCSPFFRPSDTHAAGMPPSAIPGEIYDRLHDDVIRGDRHSGWIAKNKAGLIKGAECKERDGVISASQKAEIISAVTNAEVRDFRPLLYVMPYQRVKRWTKEVPTNERAHPLSIEFIIESLPRQTFDVVEVRR